MTIAVIVFLAATLVIGVAGSRLTTQADRLADRTGLGEAIAGAVFLGASTSLPGIVTSVTTAAQGHAEFAVSHAFGGIALQAAFLSVADAAYRKANLEHAAASTGNLMQASLLVALLGLVGVAIVGPGIALAGVHPASVLIVVSYVAGLRLIRSTEQAPLWEARRTRSTHPDIPAPDAQRQPLGRMLAGFGVLALIVGVAGYAVGQAALAIGEHLGLSETVAGGLFATLSTSLPELVTSVAAVRQGALTLAVGGIIGGNTFDVLMIALSDVAYRKGSIYQAVHGGELFFLALTVLLTGVLLLGLIKREEHGIANVGFESILIVLLYLGGVAILLTS